MDTTIDKTEVALKKAKKELKKVFVPGAKFERINYLYKSQVPVGEPVIVTVDRICNDSIAFLVPTELGGNETSYLGWPIAKDAELRYLIDDDGDGVKIFNLNGCLNLSYKRI